MKALFKVFALAMILVMAMALVACGGDGEGSDTTGGQFTKPPAQTTTAPSGGDDTPGGDTTTSAKTEYTVTFYDIDGNVLTVKTVKAGRTVMGPVAPEIEGQGFDKWDTELTNIQSDLEVHPIYKRLELFTVKFYSDDSKTTVLYEEQVYDGKALKDYSLVPTVEDLPVRVGYYFYGWSDAYNVVNGNLDLTPVYKETNSIAAAVDSGSITVDGLLDDSYNVQSFFRTKNTCIYAPSTSKIPAAELSAKSQAIVYVAWDGEYIYMYARVDDNTLSYGGDEFVHADPNPFSTDSIEIWYSFEGSAPTASANCRKVGITAHKVTDPTTGQEYTKHFANVQVEQSNHFAELVVASSVNEEEGYYSVEIKFPAKKEDGTALKEGDLIFFSSQINDLRKNWADIVAEDDSFANATWEEIKKETQKWTYSSGGRGSFTGFGEEDSDYGYAVVSLDGASAE